MSDEPDLSVASEVARAAAGAQDLEQLSRPLLELLEHVIGFESTYLSVVHWEDFKQEIRYVHNASDLEIPEGAFVEWSDTLCRRALFHGRQTTDDVASDWPGSDPAQALGIVSYVSVPIVTPDGATFGTLCGASKRSQPLHGEGATLMELFARLLADQVQRDRHAAAERDRVGEAELRARASAIAMASAQHMVKTPLTVIRGAVDALLVQEDLSDAQRRSLLEAVARQASSLESCIETMLQHAGPGGPAAPIELTELMLEPELVRIVRDARVASPAHRLTLTCDDRLTCTGNQAALAQVLGHLLDNAVKYAPSGTTIEVAATGEDDRAVITVRDHGPGLSSEDLFRPFTRGATSDGVTGTGLGLYIVRSLVEAMHGTVDAHDADDGGALFRVALPARRRTHA